MFLHQTDQSDILRETFFFIGRILTYGIRSIVIIFFIMPSHKLVFGYFIKILLLYVK